MDEDDVNPAYSRNRSSGSGINLSPNDLRLKMPNLRARDQPTGPSRRDPSLDWRNNNRSINQRDLSQRRVAQNPTFQPQQGYTRDRSFRGGFNVPPNDLRQTMPNLRARDQPTGVCNDERRLGNQPPHQRRPFVPGCQDLPYQKGYPRPIGFRKIEEISQCDVKEIVVKVNQIKESLLKFIQEPMQRHDLYVLIVNILSKVCQSSFTTLKSKLILDVCNTNFFINLRNYLMDLPFAERKESNSCYWDNQEEFWKNFILICSTIVAVSPSMAVRKCRALMETVPKSCLDGLNQRHGFILPEEYCVKLNELKEKLSDSEPLEKRLKTSQLDDPPENFRELAIVPTRDDLMETKPFLRPNIINGAYNSVEHYLDIQFRLLREDCFGPFRDGINQYLSDPHRRKYDHIRVFSKVQFVEPYISQTKVGCLIQIDTSKNKSFKRINWAHNKRFLFGALVLFTKDKCATFMAGIIIDRDIKNLSEGKIPVSIIGNINDNEIYSGTEYTMIESEVYFEPYYNVLKALQDPEFPDQLAMQQYIVQVDPTSKHPRYVTENTEYLIKNISINDNDKSDEEGELPLTPQSPSYSPVSPNNNLPNSTVQKDTKDSILFKVLSKETWPTKEQLNFNTSQYEAYHLALTHEFAVIQGPPGTGKTYLGINIAKTLLHNIKADHDSCTMLVICYTNHALDQFLEAILKITKRVTRIGGQSRNEAMEKINLNNIRRNVSKSCPAQRLFNEQKYILRDSINNFRNALIFLDILKNGVISYSSFVANVREVMFLGQYYERLNVPGDPLKNWLFEGRNQYVADFQEILNEFMNEDVNVKDAKTDEYLLRKRTELILDDEDFTRPNSEERQGAMTACFSLDDSKHKIRELIAKYKVEQDYNQRYRLKLEIQDLHSRINLYNAMSLNFRDREVQLHITPRTNFCQIATHNRWCLYFMWLKNTNDMVKRDIAQLQTLVTTQIEAYEEARMAIDVQLLYGTKVIGMTTSGAARMRKLLQEISPKIVIVEEAAEVLEQHIITSLTKDCQHLILIGDHQQLRPSASHMKLAKKFNLEISLFERMITNGIHSRRLCVQHRMRPEIAQLISPHIYPDLENHPSVERFMPMRGMMNNVYFFTHDYPEENPDENTSRANHKEADLVLGLANFIMQQGYSSEDVTILTAYSGQMFYMKKARDTYAYLSDVKITVVDNYQGEESKIILLSLVRNNSENKIGFLGIENRVCVALSRAREGLYIFGNMDKLKMNSPLWQKIAATLDDNKSLGTSIDVQCQNHRDQITTIATTEDFSKVPEGGCLSKCNFQYGCGHHCKLFCHGYDREHVDTKCAEKCERILCDLQHVCPLNCRVECLPCNVLLLKTLPCGHEIKIPCHMEPDDPAVKCTTKVEAILPNCGHKIEKLCHVNLSDVKCPEPCLIRVEKCGHVCRRTCHVTDDPNHEQYLCHKACARPKKGCTANLIGERADHQCPKKCYEECSDCNVQVPKKRSNCKHIQRVACCADIDLVPCNMKCARTMACGHHCKKKCYEPCNNCQQQVKKIIPDCKHEVKIECFKIATRENCTKKCERELTCGHKCTGFCKAPCDASKCMQLVSKELDSPCGHKVRLPCYLLTSYEKGDIKKDVLLLYCKAPCGAILACKHLCGGSCASCHQGRFHAPCKQPCQQDNICGHQCDEPCNQMCPPCRKICEVKCSHSRCNKRCGMPCTPCKEKCSRKCKHGHCKRRCDEPCDWPPCDEACDQNLPCGHRCRGLCGEPCPNICNICAPDDFPKDFLGDAYGDNDKFIILQDCGHILEVDDMDNLMKGDQESIKIRTCPFCRIPIINTGRYKELINDLFKIDINPIKEKVYGSEKDIKEKLSAIKRKINHMISEYKSISKKYGVLDKALGKTLNIITLVKKPSLIQLEMLIVYIDIYEMLGVCCLKYGKVNTTELEGEFNNQLTMICNALMVKTPAMLKISQQQQKDVGNELKRMNAIVQLAKMLTLIKSVGLEIKIHQTIDDAKSAVFSLSSFEEEKCSTALKTLEDQAKLNNIVSKLERELIVKAVGLKAGHWFKCPNGHYFAIGDCGGAMVVSKCADCGVPIGGTNHTLLPTNAHASEMDNSKFPAWSEEYNNMANFNFE